MRKLPIAIFIATVSSLALNAQSILTEKEGYELVEAQQFYEQAVAMHDAQDLESAAEFYRAAANANPRHTAALYNLALVNFSLGYYGKTVATLDKLFEMTPADTSAFGLYANALQERGFTEQAIDYYSALILAFPTDENFVQRALAYVSTGHSTLALTDFDEALGLNPTNFKATLGKGIAYAEIGQFTLATAWLEQALSIVPDDATALTNLGIVQFQLGNQEASMRAFRNALWASRTADTFLARARCHLAAENFNDALADAREALLTDGENPDVYAFIGEVETAKGDFQAAIESYGVALEIKPDNPAFYTGRANASIQLGLYDEAVADLYRSLDIEPYDVNARKLLQNAYSHLDATLLGEPSPSK